MSPPDAIDELDTTEGEAREFKARQEEWNHMDPYTGADFLADSIIQVREMERVRRDWERDFNADLNRLREWET